MKSRHLARSIALQILYQCDPHPPEQAVLANTLKSHYQHFKVSPLLQDFIDQLVFGTLQNLNQVDQLLEQHIAHWKISRLSIVDRSLLRMASFEMIYLDETPACIIINEAIELAKQFGTAESSAFINGILDQIHLAHHPKKQLE